MIEGAYRTIKTGIDRWWADSDWTLEARIGYRGHLVETEELHRRVNARAHLESHARAWSADRPIWERGLLPWMAILDAAVAREDPPEWVMKYLRKAARQLLEISGDTLIHSRILDAGEQGPPDPRPPTIKPPATREQRPGRVYEALGFREPGPGNKPDVFGDPMPGFDIAMDLWREQHTESRPKAVEAVKARHKVDARTVDRAWSKWAGLIASPEARLRHEKIKAARKTASRIRPK